MTTITVPLSTVRPNGEFFQQTTEAVSFRGGSIEYNGDTAIVKLSDIDFFDLVEFNKVLDAGGEVECYPLKVRVTEEIYANGIVPDNIKEALGIDKDMETKWNEVFLMTEDNVSDIGYVSILLSYQNEWIKGSVAKLVSEALNTDLLQAI